MAKVPVLEYPHIILRRKAKKVNKIDRSIQRLADDLSDTLVASGGVGLAANQIGVLRRVIAIQVPEDPEPTIYINPEIIHREGKREVQEGCLSFPNLYGILNRSMWVKVKGMDRKSKIFRLRAEGLLAQAFEHEIDHLNGILFIDHVADHENLYRHEPGQDSLSEEELVMTNTPS